jgi:hypothetical protein
VWLIVGATKRKDADMAEYEKQKDSLKESALAQKKSLIFNDYIQNVMERMKREGSIVIYKDVLAKIAEPEPIDTMPGGLPGRQSIPIPQQ